MSNTSSINNSASNFKLHVQIQKLDDKLDKLKRKEEDRVVAAKEKQIKTVDRENNRRAKFDIKLAKMKQRELTKQQRFAKKITKMNRQRNTINDKLK